MQQPFCRYFFHVVLIFRDNNRILSDHILILQEKKLNEIVFKAMGRAISKTVMCVEIIKVRNKTAFCLFSLFYLLPLHVYFISSNKIINKMYLLSVLIFTSLVLQKIFFGLHQNTSIMSADITDTWEPLEEGLLP